MKEYTKMQILFFSFLDKNTDLERFYNAHKNAQPRGEGRDKLQAWD